MPAHPGRWFSGNNPKKGCYRAHARALDVAHHGGAPGPVLQRLQAFGIVRGLVFGAYGEASADVHDVLAVAATESARAR